jgi:hypothetical protein
MRPATHGRGIPRDRHVMLSQVSGFLSYVIAWAVVSCAVPFMFTNMVGPDARRAITALTLISDGIHAVDCLAVQHNWPVRRLYRICGEPSLHLPTASHCCAERGAHEVGISTTAGATLRDGILPQHGRVIARFGRAARAGSIRIVLRRGLFASSAQYPAARPLSCSRTWQEHRGSCAVARNKVQFQKGFRAGEF